MRFVLTRYLRALGVAAGSVGPSGLFGDEREHLHHRAENGRHGVGNAARVRRMSQFRPASGLENAVEIRLTPDLTDLSYQRRTWPTVLTSGELGNGFTDISRRLRKEPHDMSDVEVPIAIAVSANRAAGVIALRESGLLPRSTRIVVADADGQVAPELAAGVRILLSVRRSGKWIETAVASLPDLEWFQSDWAGVDSLPLEELARRGIVLTSGVGTSSRPIAEFVIAAILSAAKHLPDIVRRSDAGIWDDSVTLAELDGAVLLLVGLGSINMLVAEMAAPFGMRVRAVARRPPTSPPLGVEKVVAPADWQQELPEADYVALGLPLTPATVGMVDARAIAAMKQGAWLINVARGAHVVEDDLVAALDRGHLGGAVLDVFATEPLPSGHPLWGRRNVLVVPHHAWSSPQVPERVERLFADQLTRWIEGKPLSNVVDLSTGY
jgi:phosphoglycerate dehydrogenase-like enzyme